MTSRLALLLLSAVLLSACAASAPVIEPARLVLAYDGPSAVATPTVRRTLVVRAVTVPDYLERRSLVYRDGVELKEYPNAVWAERPGKAITRYVTQALDAQRNDYAVQPLTTASGVVPDAALTLVIDRFEAEGQGPVKLRGSWSLSAPGALIASGRFDADASLAQATAAGNVAAMQRALAEASGKLAKDLPQAKPSP